LAGGEKELICHIYNSFRPLARAACVFPGEFDPIAIQQ
jgi:hypothetical protein